MSDQRMFGAGDGSDGGATDAPGGVTCEAVREMAGAFVLGALDLSDDASVRAHLASCPEPHPEIAELGGVLAALAESVPVVEPPEGLKARIMSAAAADLEARSAAYRPPTLSEVPVDATPSPPSPSDARSAAPIAFPTAADREDRARRRSGASTASWILRIAAVLAIVALGGWNLLLRNQLDSAQQYQQAVASVLEVAAEPGSLTAVLTADGGTGDGLAAVSGSGNVTLAMQNLAPTSGSAVYEAWVIASDNVPVPIGSFTVDRSGTAAFKAGNLPAQPGIVLALTLEKGPGATAPTPPVISKGVAQPAG
jgi:anti-sigma-K factor RskA